MRRWGINSTLMPWCLGASGSVRTNVRITSANRGLPDVHTFCPLTTKWSPSRYGPGAQRRQVGPGAPVRSCPGAAVISARRIGIAHVRCCSGVPKVMSEAAMMPTPWELKLGTILRRASSSLVCVLLQDRGVAAAELRRVAGHQPAPLSNCSPLPLGVPTAARADDDRGRSSAAASAGRVVVEERHQLRRGRWSPRASNVSSIALRNVPSKRKPSLTRQG